MICIATHKIASMPQYDGYKPIHVGAVLNKKLPYTPDCLGDNISEKNKNYCELTAIYWLWKNVNEPYKGIVHYRRYFGKNSLSSSISNVYSQKELIALLNNYDIILANPDFLKQNAKNELLINCCTVQIFHSLKSVIEKLHPTYINTFENFFKQNKVSLLNMMFAKTEIFDNYCSWLFSILFELEKNIDISDLNPYQQRLYGFLSERLLNVWVIENKLKIKYLPIINTETSIYQKLQHYRRNITNSIYFNIFQSIKS